MSRYNALVYKKFSLRKSDSDNFKKKFYKMTCKTFLEELKHTQP